MVWGVLGAAEACTRGEDKPQQSPLNADVALFFFTFFVVGINILSVNYT